MRVLLDEDVPVQLAAPLQQIVAPNHAVSTVAAQRWSGTLDVPLFGKAQRAGFTVIVTNNREQLVVPAEVTALAKSGLHHVSYTQKHRGRVGLGLALGALIASLPSLLDELEGKPQQLVTINGIDPRGKRFSLEDPRRNPYWPRGGRGRTKAR